MLLQKCDCFGSQTAFWLYYPGSRDIWTLTVVDGRIKYFARGISGFISLSIKQQLSFSILWSTFCAFAICIRVFVYLCIYVFMYLCICVFPSTSYHFQSQDQSFVFASGKHRVAKCHRFISLKIFAGWGKKFEIYQAIWQNQTCFTNIYISVYKIA